MFVGRRKDGGSKSTVTGWFFEIKSLFTVALLRFDNGTREAYHSHAFDCASIVIGGKLVETFYDLTEREHSTGKCLVTRKSDLHKVRSEGTTWVLTVRGPWAKHWFEIVPSGFGFDRLLKLTNGRRLLGQMQTWSYPGHIDTDDAFRLNSLGLELTSPDFRDVP